MTPFQYILDLVARTREGCDFLGLDLDQASVLLQSSILYTYSTNFSRLGRCLMRSSSVPGAADRIGHSSSSKALQKIAIANSSDLAKNSSQQVSILFSTTKSPLASFMLRNVSKTTAELSEPFEGISTSLFESAASFCHGSVISVMRSTISQLCISQALRDYIPRYPG